MLSSIWERFFQFILYNQNLFLRDKKRVKIIQIKIIKTLNVDFLTVLTTQNCLGLGLGDRNPKP